MTRKKAKDKTDKKETNTKNARKITMQRKEKRATISNQRIKTRN